MAAAHAKHEVFLKTALTRMITARQIKTSVLPFPEECPLYCICHTQLDKLGIHFLDAAKINDYKVFFFFQRCLVPLYLHGNLPSFNRLEKIDTKGFVCIH